jgi:predicted nucleic-acid-binding Zn-ribbon protein
MPRGPSLVTVGADRHRFTCTVCRGTLFHDREIKLNTTDAEFFGMAWANESADGLVCQQCGYLHAFVSGSVELWEPDGGYPENG